jgi:hypothetical protein
MVALGLSVTHLPGSYALTAADPAQRAGRLARRRRALETVEKVVTAPTMGVVGEVIFVVLPGQVASSRGVLLVGSRQRTFMSVS